MSKGRTAVILQRAKQRIGIDLVASCREKTAAVVAAEIVTIGADCTVDVEHVFSRSAGLQNCVPDLQRRATRGTVVEDTAGVVRGRVAA